MSYSKAYTDDLTILCTSDELCLSEKVRPGQAQVQVANQQGGL